MNRYLSHARAAGSGEKLGASTDVKKIVDDLVMAMNRLYTDQGLDVQTCQMDSLRFRGDEQDLEEIIGNVIDNACKWAHKKVVIRGKASNNGYLKIIIEDDGRGIPEQERISAIQRGRRLDVSVPGSGLGLSIVQHLVTMYRGKTDLEESELGGLKVTLTLPSVG